MKVTGWLPVFSFSTMKGRLVAKMKIRRTTKQKTRILFLLLGGLRIMTRSLRQGEGELAELCWMVFVFIVFFKVLWML